MYREFQGWPFHKNKQTNIQSQIVAYWAATFAAKKRPFLRPDISYFKIFHRLHKNFQVIRGFMRNGIFVHKLMADLNSELLVILFKLKRLNQTSLRGLLWQINRLTRGVDKTDVAGYRCPGALDKQCQALTIKLMLNAEHISPLDRVPFIKVSFNKVNDTNTREEHIKTVEQSIHIQKDTYVININFLQIDADNCVQEGFIRFWTGSCLVTTKCDQS